MSGPRRRSDVQGLRALAVLVVVGYHAAAWPSGGFVGVDIFFVISGFVIAGVLLAETDDRRSINVGAFLARRVRRLLPALAVCITVVLGVTALVGDTVESQPSIASTALAAVGLGANLHLYRHSGYFDPGEPDPARNPLHHTWSLSVEEQFYLLVPTVAALLVAWSRRRSGAARRAALGLLVVGSLASFAAAWLLGASTSVPVLQAPGRAAFYGMPTRIWEFGAGFAAALLVRRGGRARRRGSTAVASASLVVLIASMWWIDPALPFPAPSGAVPVLATGLLLVAGEATWVGRALSSPAMVWIGDRSYGWYLWHWPALVMGRWLWPDRWWVAAIGAGGSLAVAAASYRWIEQPIRRGRTMAPRRLAALCVVGFGAPAALAFAVSFGASHWWRVDEPLDWYAFPRAGLDRCIIINRDMPNDLPTGRCRYRNGASSASMRVDEQSGRPVVAVLGDRQVDGVAEAVIAAVGDRADVVVWGRSGCPFVAASPLGFPRCTQWQGQAEHLIDLLDPVAVVIANDTPTYLDPAVGENVIAVPNDRRPSDPRAALALWTRGLASALDRLAARRIPAVVVQPPPAWGATFPRGRLSPLRPQAAMSGVRRSDVVRDRGPWAAAERSVAARHGASVVDPVDVLCGAVCSATNGGHWLYYDGFHLNRFGAEAVVPAILEALVESSGHFAGSTGPDGVGG